MTPLQLRMLQPLPGRMRLLWLFGWPLLMAWSLGFLALLLANRLEQVSMALVVLTVVSPEPAKVRPKAPLTPPVTVSFPLEEPTYAALARVISPL